MNWEDEDDFEDMPSLCPCCREICDFSEAKPDPLNRSRMVCKHCERKRMKELRAPQ